MTYHGHIKNGRIVLDALPTLPDGTQVEVVVIPIPTQSKEPTEQKDREIPTLYERMKPFIGCIDDLPPDASQNIDHYLYGHPKK